MARSPEFGAYLGMTYLLLTFLPWQPVWGTEGNIDIFPESAIIEVGTDLNITCTLRNESKAGLEIHTSSDIVWYKNQDIIPSEEYHILNDTTSCFSIVNSTLTDSATYNCALLKDTNVTEYLSSTVQVGYKPRPVLSLTCASHNIIEYYCEWIPAPTSNILNDSHIFQYKPAGKWKNCPDYRSLNMCFISEDHHNGFGQDVRVTSSNVLGENAVKSSRFNPDKETIPLPPRILTLTSKSSTILTASWQLPTNWDPLYRSLLKYRLRWASPGDPQHWLGEKVLGGVLSCEIGLLKPYTSYVMEVASGYYEHWGEWSGPVQGRTDEAAPIGTVQNLQTSNLNGTSDHVRNVWISWQTVPEQKQRGPILGYLVTVIFQSSSIDHPIFNKTVNTTEVVVKGLKKFWSYTVKITAFNSIGTGPVKDGEIKDMTTNPAAPSVVRAETLSHRSVLVSWEKPTPVKGYIRHYTVHWIKARGQDQGQYREVNSTNQSYRVDDLEGNVLYSFKVSVTNRIGASGWSTEVQNTTEEWIPEASPTNVTTEPVTNNPNSLFVNWIDVSEEDAHGQIQGHHIYYCHVAKESLSAPLCSLNVSDCLENKENKTFSETKQKPVMLTGVHPFSHYLVWVSAFTSIGEGPTSRCPSSGLTSEGIPSQPLNVNVTGWNATSIGLSWSPPLEKNGIIRNYTILLKSNTSSDQQEFYAGGVQSYLVEGLYGYIYYILQVRACTTMCGPVSDEVYQRTEIGAPELPRNFRIQPRSHNLVTLRWDPPVHPNGPIDHYLVSYQLHREQPSTTSPTVIVHAGSESKTSSLAGNNERWSKSTELRMQMDVDCSQAPFLFKVVAVNVISGSYSFGEAATSVLSECLEFETTLSKLFSILPPVGVILLAALLTSLYCVLNKFGRSWPDPVYTEMVKNKKNLQPVPRPKRAEKEEFDTIQTVCPPDLEEVSVAEEYSSQLHQCPMQTSMTNPITDLHFIKRDTGGKQMTLRTISIDSGIPPSPQDQLNFSTSEDIFDLEDIEISGLMHDTYSLGEPKGLLGEKGGYPPTSSMCLSSSDRCHGVLPAIDEGKCLDQTVENILGDKGSKSTKRDWLVVGEGDDDIKVSSTVKKNPSVAFKDQTAPVTDNKPDSPAVGNNGQHVAPDSCSVSHYVKCMTSGVNELTQETVFKSKRDGGYVPVPLTSVMAIPQVGSQPPRSLEKSMTSNYVSKESLASPKLGMDPDVAGKEGLVALHKKPSSRPFVQRGGIGYGGIGYVKIEELSCQDNKKHDDAGIEEQKESTWNDTPLPSPSPSLSDYVRGVDLHMILENKSELSKSSDSPALPIYIPGEMENGELQDLTEITVDGTKVKKSREKAVRSRTDSSSSSSGYGSGNRGQVSGYVVVSNQPILTVSDAVSRPDSSRDTDTSFVKYISNDGFGVGFVNDCHGSANANDSVGFSDGVAPSVLTKSQSGNPQGQGQDGHRNLSGYVSHITVLEAETTFTNTPGVEWVFSPTKPHASKLDIYQVPRRACQGLGKDRNRHESDEGDDGYVPCSGDSGYVLRYPYLSQSKKEYMPMSPIANTEIA